MASGRLGWYLPGQISTPPHEPAGDEPADSRHRRTSIADRGYFETLRVPLLAGRLFDGSERESDRAVVVVNEALARRHLGAWALGRRLRLRWHGQPLTAEVVGVVGDVRHARLDEAPAPEAFLSPHQVPFASMTYVLRTPASPARLVDSAKGAIWSVDPRQSFYRTAAVAELVDRSVADRRALATALAIFAGLALLLTASGLYALISLVGAERAHEFGVRRALGASGRQVVGLVLLQALQLAVPGVAIGLALAALTAPALGDALYQVSPYDPATVAGASAGLAVVSVLAALGPARRALALDPATALREE